MSVFAPLLRVASAAELRGAAPAALADAIVLPRDTVKFAPVRLDSFVRGRAAAILALRALGVEPGPLAIAVRGAPVWPPGVVGSITHDDAFAAAAVASHRELRGVGIDAQRITDEPEDTVALVANANELERLEACDARAQFSVVFSAKESLYKCLAPTVGELFGFEDARVVRADASELELRLVRALHRTLPAESAFVVRYSTDGERAYTAAEWV